MKIAILKTLGAFKEGQIVNVEADSNGIPLARFWRRRLKDSDIDGFCKVVDEKKKEPKPATDKKVSATQDSED
jgi:hypothetical protein